MTSWKKILKEWGNVLTIDMLHSHFVGSKADIYFSGMNYNLCLLLVHGLFSVEIFPSTYHLRMGSRTYALIALSIFGTDSFNLCCWVFFCGHEQLHISVQFKPAEAHLHLVHTPLQVHVRNNFLHSSIASLWVIHTGDHLIPEGSSGKWLQP